MTSTLSPDEGSNVRQLRFLLEEGLDLLAAFRMISDAEKRREIIALVQRAAAQEGAIGAVDVLVPFSSEVV